jgi:hypothetical protein
MKVFRNHYLYDGFMDDDVLELCNAMNALPGIETTESCCGHGCEPFSIYFKVKKDEQDGLFFLTRCVDRRYWKYGYLWKIELCVGDMYDGTLPITYILSSGPIVGEDAYTQAHDLVENMNDHINHKSFLNLYDLDVNKFDTQEATQTI